MSMVAWVAIAVSTGSVLLAVFIVMTRARGTPYLCLKPELLPRLGDSLEMLAGLTGSTVHQGNSARVLQNGAFFAALLADIRSARQTIHFESFVWAKGVVERDFVEALSAKACEGLKVRVLLDAVGGSRGDPEHLKHMTGCGVEIDSYCKPRWFNLHRFNHRTHRKIAVIDGTIGWTFGHGVGDQWLGNGEDAEHWRDTAIRLEGPVVHALQSVFAQNWIEETHSLIDGEGVFPGLSQHGDIAAHVVSSASGDAISAVALLYTIAIASARTEVLIQNPYFAPDDGMIDLFEMMVKRGVAVHLMVPGKHTDSPFVRRAGCYLYAGLLEAGVRLYEFQPTLIHQKIVVVDECWAHVGSTNFDARSLALNEEIGVGVLDAAVSAELKQAFTEDLKQCRELKLEEWKRRPLKDRLFEWLAWQVHDQL